MKNSHVSVEIFGAGPAESTGKLVVSYCPGGSAGLSACLRPRNPDEKIAMELSSRRVRNPNGSGCHCGQAEDRDNFVVFSVRPLPGRSLLRSDCVGLWF